MEIGSGSLAAALGLLGTGLAIMFPENRWVGLLLVGCAVVALFLDVKLDGSHIQAALPSKRIAALGMLISALAFVGCGTWYFWPKVPASEVAAEQKRIRIDSSINGGLPGQIPKNLDTGTDLKALIELKDRRQRGPDIKVAVVFTNAGGGRAVIRSLHLIHILFQDLSNDTQKAALENIKVAATKSGLTMTIADELIGQLAKIGDTGVYYLVDQPTKIEINGIVSTGPVAIKDNDVSEAVLTFARPKGIPSSLNSDVLALRVVFVTPSGDQVMRICPFMSETRGVAKGWEGSITTQPLAVQPVQLLPAVTGEVFCEPISRTP